MLFGRLSRGVAYVDQARVYRGGRRARMEASVDPDRFQSRVKALQGETGLRFVTGTF